MRKGFIFNYELCVGCRACSAACMLENGWELDARRIHVHNKEHFTPEPVISVSMACNHCGEPVCLTGCPTSAYRRDAVTGAVLVDEKRCIGCRYCKWNCPYGAPRFNKTRGIIEKCNLCYKLVMDGLSPACAGACPTGALDFGVIPDLNFNAEFEFIPEKNLNPSQVITGSKRVKDTEVIPELTEIQATTGGDEISILASSSWSLLLFSFLAGLSVSWTLSDFITGKSEWHLFSIFSVIIALPVTFFHLGSKLRAWMSVRNLRNSPLSREILSLLLYITLLSALPRLDSPLFRLFVSLSGLSLLLLIDSVYTRAGSENTRYHSGNVFITSLLIISFFSRQVVPFVFIASLKLLTIMISGQITGRERTFFSLRFMRIIMLLISGFILISGTGINEPASAFIFLAGEFCDRVLFYLDFAPLNIKNTIKKPIKAI